MAAGGVGMADEPDHWDAWLDRHGAALVLLARQRVASRADAVAWIDKMPTTQQQVILLARRS